MHRYYDIPGASLIDAANAAGFNAFSLDRPDYGNSKPLRKGKELFRRNGDAVCEAIDEFIKLYAPTILNVEIIGHSIGGAVGICAAALQPSWLAGIAVSGIGLQTNLSSKIIMNLLPPMHRIAMPNKLRNSKLFGPPGTHDESLIARAIELSLVSSVRQELKEVYGWWPQHLAALAQRVTVPVDIAMGDFDHLWRATPEALRTFGALFANSPRVATDIIADSGHCIDHHHTGRLSMSGN